MIKWHIDNDFTKLVQSSSRFNDLTEDEHKRLYLEVRNVVLQGIEKEITEKYISGAKLNNEVSSLLMWVMGATDDKTEKTQTISSEGSYADFDIDFSKERRDEVVVYLKEKYGEDRCANVVTFNTLAARAAIKGAQRALGASIDMGNNISKNIPNVPGIKLQEAIDASKLLMEMQKGKNGYEGEKKIIEVALQLEGLPQALGVHACAFIISDKAITNYMPEMIATKKDDGKLITQFEYYDIEAIGCLKWDLLGLKTLDVIADTVKLVKERKGVDIDIDNIDVDDPGIYKVINAGHNTGIFQFESDIFSTTVQKIKPGNINELSDITSLLRPGPISMGMPDQYADAKLTGNKYKYNLKDKKLISKVWEICATSYGLMVYQEQVIKCFTEIGGFNEIEGDNARRAMGKKKEDVMAALKDEFVKGGAKQGYNEKDLAELFKQIEGFAGYGFNKSHAICYSVITAQTAYLSNYYPLEFYTTLLSIDSGNTDDVRRYVSAVKKRGYTISAPEVNSSGVDFLIDSFSIMFGISGIKGVGKAVSNRILKKRPKKNGYRGLGHFVLRNIVDLNKKVLEQYAKAGMFREFGVNKTSAMHSVQGILEFIDIQKSISEYYTIFDLVKKIDLEEYFDECLVQHTDKEDPLEYEIETLGLYITKHPLEDYIFERKGNVYPVENLKEAPEDYGIVTVGAISNIDIRKTKSKTNMASFNITGPEGDFRCVVFPKVYAKVQEILAEGKMVAIDGIIREDSGEKQLIVNNVRDNYRQYLGKFVPKETSYTGKVPQDTVVEIDVDDNVVFSDSDYTKIKIKINEDLSLILWR